MYWHSSGKIDQSAAVRGSSKSLVALCSPDPQGLRSTAARLDAADAVVEGSALAALFCFRNLIDIDLEIPGGLDMDDHSAADMARAWPRVKELRLRANPRYPSSMSLLGIWAFAQHCPELTILTISIDASTVPPLDDSLETTVSQSALLYLDVGASQIIDPFPVAWFLSKLFANPSLAEIWTLQETLDLETSEDESG